MKILILAPYPKQQSPNQRFRFEQYLSAFDDAGIDYDYRPFWTNDVWKVFYQRGHLRTKTHGLLKGIGQRLALLPNLNKYDYVFIHREGLPVGPPVLELLIAAVWRKKIIYDFDDAIWIRNYSEANKGIARFLKFHRKVKVICRLSHRISTGNDFLANYAQRYNRDVVVIPTTIDTENHHNQLKHTSNAGKLIVGWTGTHSTLAQLREVEVQMRAVQQEIDFELQVICNEDPQFELLQYRYIPWRAETEINDLLQFDIGIMPLKNTDWERGKCGFKALQYMSLGIPVIASLVGANSQIIEHEKSGILIAPENSEAWVLWLKKLLNQPELRERLGKRGRQRVVEHYSVQSNKEKYIRLFS